MRGGECVAYEEQVIEVAVEVGKRVLVHATGHPAKIVIDFGFENAR